MPRSAHIKDAGAPGMTLKGSRQIGEEATYLSGSHEKQQGFEAGKWC